MRILIAATLSIFGIGSVYAESYSSIGNWHIRESSSPFDDSKVVSMELYSLDRISGGRNGKPRLHLRCEEGETSAYITFAGNFMSDIQSYGEVRYRLDSDSSVIKSMHVSTDNRALGLWSRDTAIPFIEDMFRHERMVVSATPYNSSPQIFNFNVVRTEEAVANLRDACNW